jgi:DNA-binding GntR family transcriptional regulator
MPVHGTPDGLDSDVRARLESQRPLLDRMSRAERVAEIVRQMIINGTLRPGSRLSEPDICAALDVSRNTLRESFRSLVKDRLVTHELNRGVFVRVPTPQDISELYTCRRVIEGAAMRAFRPGDNHLADLAEVIEALRQADERSTAQDWPGVGTADLGFHRAIVGLNGSMRINELMEGTWAELRLVFLVMGDPNRFHGPYLDRNHRMLDALVAGDPAKAEVLLMEYLDDAEAEILGVYEAPAQTSRLRP